MLNDDKEASMTDHERRSWTFLTNHARVLVTISQNPDIRVRDAAAMTGITERSTQRIVAELEEAGYLSHERVGRRNHYQVSASATFRHPLEQNVEIGPLLRLFSDVNDQTLADGRES